MNRIIIIFLIQVLGFNLFAHVGGHGSPSKIWTLKNGQETIKANFIKYEAERVFLFTENHSKISLPISQLSDKDQAYIAAKTSWIHSANHSKIKNSTTSISSILISLSLIVTVLILCIILVTGRPKQQYKLGFGALAFALIILACENKNAPNENTGAINTKVPANELTFLKSIFGVFDKVTTRHDEKYFYIESNGMPDHEMMTGITNWQQQVPIPHDYSGKNSWAIPIQPQLSANPLSTKENFMKGAIAIAVNGIPIFNPLNNRREDANAIGELDRWGGHCGRADDYHYHLPPSHLQEKVGQGKPIAYALDGFPLLGETSLELDKNLGRFNADSSYQYHAVKEYPYLIAKMRGKVEINPRTKAPENEIAPQAKTRGVRPALRPLRGATITGYNKKDSKNYELTYTLEAKTFKINYRWDDNGQYQFEYINPDGRSKKERFQRK